MTRTLLLTAFTLAASVSFGQSGLWVDLPASAKTTTDIQAASDSAMRAFSKNATRLSKANRDRLVRTGHYDKRFPFSLPTTVRLSRNGVALPPRKSAPGDLVLQFDASGTRAFPAAYRAQLQSTFDTVKSTLNLLFGEPASGGVVLVKNYDADIADRDAVAGGYYLPNNGSGQPEIRFPVYVSPEAAAVNFVHTLLLAYIGPNPYQFDAFQEGLVRATVMRAVRTPGAMPASLNAAQMEAVLDNTYDVGSYYDWYNQRSLGASQFIANNLRTAPLPTGGSLGGVYLLRYQMAGSAWQKLLAENPGFIREFNLRFYANTALSGNVPGLVTLGQTALNSVTGLSNATVEGLSFSEWFRRQYILETKDTRGPKLIIQPVPILSGLAGSDFGVFDIAATYFETQPGANEVLLSGLSYPIFWDQSFNRIFPSVQEDQMPIAGAYGSVTPNIPNISGNQIYRSAVEFPVGDRIARAYLPVGALATPASPDPKNFAGTVTGLTLTTGQTGLVRVSIGSTILAAPSLINGAFGTKVDAASFQGYARLRVDVMRRVGTTNTVVYTRYVNKGPGPIALDLRVGGDTTYTGTFTKGIQASGLPIEPYVSQIGDLLGLNDSTVLAARYNPTISAYDLYPDSGGMVQSSGHYLRLPAGGNVAIAGRIHPGTPVAVALKPGWNMVVNPLNETTAFNRVQVVKVANSPIPWTEAEGIDVGSQLFTFTPGANDPSTGAPETGSYTAAPSFAAGKATFVRVLAPEGVTLLFTPSTLGARTGRVFTPNGWRLSTMLEKGTQKAEVVVGQSSTGSPSIDNREDSLLPPRRVNGLLSSSEGTTLLYRDIRLLGKAETYKLRFDGLVSGQTYTVRFAANKGTPPSFVMRDKVTLIHRAMSAGQTYTFVARSAAHRIELVFGGS